MSTLQPDEEFVNLLSDLGKDFSLVQGLGGNCSVKSNKMMLVKASGKRLAEAHSKGYFYEVEISDGEYRETGRAQEGKPSIEVFLHALLPHKYVLHLHSTQGVAIAMLAAQSEVIRNEMLDLGIIMIDYARPGIALKEEIKSKMTESSDQATANTFLMQNHGTLFGARSVDELREVVTKFEEWANSKIGGGLEFALTPNNQTTLLDEVAIDHIKWHARVNWRITPDHVVFLGVTAPQQLLGRLTAPMTVLEFLRAVLPDVEKIGPREEQLLWFVNVVQFLPKKNFPTLSENEAHDLTSWEAERHRVRAAAKGKENRIV